MSAAFKIGLQTHVDTVWIGTYPDGNVLAFLLRQPRGQWNLIMRFHRYSDDQRVTRVLWDEPWTDKLDDMREFARKTFQLGAQITFAPEMREYRVDARGEAAWTLLKAALADQGLMMRVHRDDLDDDA